MYQLEQIFHQASAKDCIAARTRSQQVFPLLPTIHPFVSASDLQNFCLDDLFADYLDLFVPAPQPHPLQDLFEKGIAFEERILVALRESTHLPLPKLSSGRTSREYDVGMSRRDFRRTLEAMQRGDPILYSAYLWNEHEKCHGIPDLLVRNDCLHLLSPSLANRPARTSSFGSYFYLPVEIKYSSLHRLARKNTLSNAGRLKYYKTQLMMYCRLLTHVQGLFPCEAFLIGKRIVESDGTVSRGELTELGTVDYLIKDSAYAVMCEQAIDWMRRVKSEGRSWRVGALPRELYPNMKADHPYHQSLKSEWATHLNDITQVWRCSATHRDNARRWKIYAWTDKQCTAEKLGIPAAYAETVDALLEVNRSEHETHRPLHLPSVVCPFGAVDEVMYVDFEVCVDESEEMDRSSERIFMIGVWYRGEYSCMVMKDKKMAEERRVLLDFHQFWETCGQPNCLFWYAEKSFWERAIDRHPDLLHLSPVSWIDLYEPWVSQRIVVKGALNFKLKTLIRALRAIGFTSIELPPKECGDGLEAMRLAAAFYAREDEEKDVLTEFASIVHYNRLDCQYVQELYRFVTALKDAPRV